MSGFGFSINPQDYDTEQKGDFTDLPTGIYRLECEAQSYGDNSKGTGKVLGLTLTVLEPEEFAGRKVFENFNLVHENEKAQEIAREDVSKMCRAVEHFTALDDPEDLVFKPFMAKLGWSKSKNKAYEPKFGVRNYFYPDTGELPTPAIDAVQPAAAPANDNATCHRAAAKPARAAAKPTGSKPWGKAPAESDPDIPF